MDKGTKTMPMNWHRFLAYIALWLTVPVSLYTAAAFVEVYAELAGGDVSGLRAVAVAMGALHGLMLVLAVRTSAALARRKNGALELLSAFVVLCMVCCALHCVAGPDQLRALGRTASPLGSRLDRLMATVNASYGVRAAPEINVEPAFWAAAFLVVFWVNRAYYAKREHLFVN